MRLAAAVVAVLACPGAVAQMTWIVDDDGGPGVHFTSLPAAVAAAASGDTLLVAPGHYEPFHVTGKALTIRGDGPASTFVDALQLASGSFPDYVLIQDPPPGQVFTLSGLRIVHPLPAFTTSYAARLALIGSPAVEGIVIVHDVITEPAGGTAWVGGVGVRVDGLQAHLSRCSFLGAEWFQGNTAFGYPGGWVRAALVIAESCTFRGGDVTIYSYHSNCRGGPGLLVNDAQLWLTRVHCAGGSPPVSSISSSAGGNGLEVRGTTAVRLFGGSQHVLAGGLVGVAPTIWPGYGLFVESPAAALLHGPITTQTTTAGGSVSPSVVGNGTVAAGLPRRPELLVLGSAPTGGSLAAVQPVTVGIEHGSPGQLFVLLLGTGPDFSLLPALTSEPLLLANAGIAVAGLLDPAGGWAVAFVPALHTPQLIGRPLHLQAFVFEPAWLAWRGSNAVVHHIAP